MKVKELIKLLRLKNTKISIRKENRLCFIAYAKSEEIKKVKEEEIIDIIPYITNRKRRWMFYD